MHPLILEIFALKRVSLFEYHVLKTKEYIWNIFCLAVDFGVNEKTSPVLHLNFG